MGMRHGLCLLLTLFAGYAAVLAEAAILLFWAFPRSLSGSLGSNTDERFRKTVEHP